jgi:hypothetical protein
MNRGEEMEGGERLEQLGEQVEERREYVRINGKRRKVAVEEVEEWPRVNLDWMGREMVEERVRELGKMESMRWLMELPQNGIETDGDEDMENM